MRTRKRACELSVTHMEKIFAVLTVEQDPVRYSYSSDPWSRFAGLYNAQGNPL